MIRIVFRTLRWTFKISSVICHQEEEIFEATILKKKLSKKIQMKKAMFENSLNVYVFDPR